MMACGIRRASSVDTVEFGQEPGNRTMETHSPSLKAARSKHMRETQGIPAKFRGEHWLLNGDAVGLPPCLLGTRTVMLRIAEWQSTSPGQRVHYDVGAVVQTHISKQTEVIRWRSRKRARCPQSSQANPAWLPNLTNPMGWDRLGFHPEWFPFPQRDPAADHKAVLVCPSRLCAPRTNNLVSIHSC